MEVFVLKALEKLRYESSRSDKEFRESCDAVIRTIQENSQKPNRPPDDGDADKYWQPFQLACMLKSSKMKALALDSIEKMIAFGYLRGIARVKPAAGGAERPLIENVVETICSCRDDPADAVQLQVIKALNTAVSSTSVAVHEGSLLLAVRAVYHVCLGSRNAVNRNTARGTLRQMLAIVFVRMEKWHSQNATAEKEKAAAAAAAAAAAPAPVPEAAAPAEAAPVAAPAPAPAPAPVPVLTKVKVKKVVTRTRTEERTRTEVQLGPAPASSLWPNVYPEAYGLLGLELVLAPVETSVTVTDAVPVTYQEEVEVEEEQWLMPDGSPAPAASIPAPVAAPAPAPPATPLKGGASASGTAAEPTDALGGLPSQAHRDAFLVFRSLCRLTAVAEEEAPLLPAGGGILAALGGAARGPATPAQAAGPGEVKVMSDEALLANPVALQSKLLSLELVVGLLESAGPALQNGPKFIASIKTYLCVGLLKNFVSTIPALSTLSLKAFMALVKGFKRHVAAEVEVFISTIFLRMLTSSTASQEQKLSVLTAFRSMVSDPGSVLEMFLNYDCSEGRQNVFEDSIRTLAGISQGPGKAGEAIAAMALATQQAQAAAAASGADGAPPAPKLPPGTEAGAIKAAAMQALSSVIQSMVVLADAAAKQIADSEGRSLIDSAAAAAAVADKAGAGKGKAAGGKDADDDDDIDDLDVPASGPQPSPTGASGSGPSPASSNGPLSPAAPASASAALARSYEDQKRRRALLEKAAVKFAVKPRKGVEFLQAHGLCGTKPSDIAAVFHELSETLDKTAIGEYMGEEKASHIEVLHAYVDQLDFTGLAFDDAIRKYLSGFRLPGEAQKIDRMMEKLAERYCKCNPGVFPTADTAFILAYSIIMLHTDAHNPNIKQEKKMTKESFLRNNRGIANGADLPAEFLGAIYDSIVSRPFTLREDDALRAKQASNSGVVDEKARREMLLKERADIVAAGTAQLSSLTTARRQQLAAGEGEGAGGLGGISLSSYVSVSDVALADHVRPMFEVCWGPLLAVWSVNFEQSGDGPEEGWTVNTCLAGFNQAIHVAGALRMETERDTLVATLAKFTGLALGEAASGCVGGGPGSIRELKGKHVAAVRALLSMAFHEGNNLGVAWGPTLAVVSAVARLQNMAMGGRDDSDFFHSQASAAQDPRAAILAQGGNSTAARREVDRITKLMERDATVDRQNASLLAAHVPEADVSRLFARSGTLNSKAIVDFVQQLGAVSLYELASCVVAPPELPQIGKAAEASSSSTSSVGTTAAMGLGKPRIFSLQKVVEVADFNMPVRGRMAWASMWEHLSRYFTAVCCSSNTQVAMFAIDSLKQLSLKFCAKPELKSFTFQNKFLHPFAAIMEATVPVPGGPGAAGRGGAAGGQRGARPEIRELVLHVCANIIRARAANIRSGWRSFLAVYAAAANDHDELLVSLAFSMAHEVVDTHFAAVAAAGAYTDAVKCMVSFGSNHHPLFALRAIDHLASLGAHLARGRVPIDGEDKEGSKSSAEAKASAGEDGAGASASGPSSPSSSSDPSLWYDLDGPENADVVDDRHDMSYRGLQARLTGSTADAHGSALPDAPRVGGRGYSMENFDGSGDGHHGGPAGGAGSASGAAGGYGRADDEEEVDPNDEAAAEARAAEDAMDAAMLNSDGQPGGKIRRFKDTTAHMTLWFPLLTGLAGLISNDGRLPVRMRALHALFALLRRYGPSFDASLWALVYSGVLMPIFDDVFHVLHEGDEQHVAGLARTLAPGSNGSASGANGDMEGGDSAPHYSLAEFSSRSIPAQAPARTALADKWPGAKPSGPAGGRAKGSGQLDEHEWLRTTCMPALSSLVRLQSRFFTRLGFLLPGLLRLIERCIDQEIEGLARVGVASLRLLLAEAGPRFNSITWDVVTASLGRMFESTTPQDLVKCRVALLGEGADDGLLEEDEDEAAAAAEEQPEAATPQAAPPAPLPPALAVWSTPSSSLPVPVLTPYGSGQLLSLPEAGSGSSGGDGSSGDGMAKVALPWGVAFIHVPSQLAAVRASLGLKDSEQAVAAPAGPATTAALAAAAVPKPLPKPRRVPRATTLPFNSARVVTQCVVQLELIGAVGVLTEAQLSSLSLHHVQLLLGLLQGSSGFARRFNADRLLRRALWDVGFMRFAKHNKLPSLLRQETAATRQLLALLLRLYTYDLERPAGEAAGASSSSSAPSPTSTASGASGSNRPWADLSISHLQVLIKGILARYNQLAVDVQRAQVLALPPHMHASLQFTYSGGAAWGGYTPERDALLVGEHSRDLFREAAAYGPMVIQLLEGLLAFTDEQFSSNLPWLYPLLTGLITCGSVEIRQQLSQVFAVRLRKMLPLDGNGPVVAGASGSARGAGAAVATTEAAGSAPASPTAAGSGAGASPAPQAAPEATSASAGAATTSGSGPAAAVVAAADDEDDDKNDKKDKKEKKSKKSKKDKVTV